MPRSDKIHPTTTAKSRASEQARVAAGGRRLPTIVLDAAEARALAVIRSRDGSTITAAVGRALVEMAGK